MRIFPTRSVFIRDVQPPPPDLPVGGLVTSPYPRDQEALAARPGVAPFLKSLAIRRRRSWLSTRSVGR